MTKKHFEGIAYILKSIFKELKLKEDEKLIIYHKFDDFLRNENLRFNSKKFYDAIFKD
jgi:hypothetical protein